MEEKLKRECKSYLEKLFKKQDTLSSGSVSHQGMKLILKEMIPEYEQDEELTEMMKELGRRSKYTVLNKATNQFDVHYLEDSIDFPSALYICVYFLKRFECKNSDCFSGRSTVSFSDLKGMTCSLSAKDREHQKKRLF